MEEQKHLDEDAKRPFDRRVVPVVKAGTYVSAWALGPPTAAHQHATSNRFSQSDFTFRRTTSSNLDGTLGARSGLDANRNLRLHCDLLAWQRGQIRVGGS